MNIEELKICQLTNQHLLDPSDKLTVIRDLCGAQAQFFSNAIHSLRIRCNDFDEGTVADGLSAVGNQGIGQQVRHGCLAVGAGDADHQRGLGSQIHKVGADLQRDDTGVMRCIAAQHADRFLDALGCEDSQMKT